MYAATTKTAVTAASAAAPSVAYGLVACSVTGVSSWRAVSMLVCAMELPEAALHDLADPVNERLPS